MGQILLQKLNALTLRQGLWLLALASMGLTASAFFIEHVLGAIPCEMCWWQRYAHWAMGMFAALGLFVWPRAMLLGAGLSASAGLFVAVWQVLAQHKLIPLPSSCSGDVALQVGDLLSQLQGMAPPPACDEVNFTIFGLSLAAWNIPVMLGVLGFVFFMKGRK